MVQYYHWATMSCNYPLYKPYLSLMDLARPLMGPHGFLLDLLRTLWISFGHLTSMGLYIGLPIYFTMGLRVNPYPVGFYGLLWAQDARDLRTKCPIRSCLKFSHWNLLLPIFRGSLYKFLVAYGLGYHAHWSYNDKSILNRVCQIQRLGKSALHVSL